MPFEIRHDTQASSTPAYQLISEGMNYLTQEGFVQENNACSGIEPNDQVLYAEEADGEIIGTLVFRHTPDTRSFHILLGYVEPSSQRKGVYTALYAFLLTLTRKYGVHRISGSTHPDNHAMAAVCRKMNRQCVALTFEALV